MKCKFSIAWTGECGERWGGIAEPGQQFCPKHLDKKCVICNAQGVTECSETNWGWVCGQVTCENHKCPCGR